jgi:hypothetical protein
LKQDLKPLRNLSNADVRFNKNCRLYWQWKGDHFKAATRKGQCITSSYTPTEILVEGHALLYRHRLVRHDMNYELSGEVRPRQGGASPELFDKQNQALLITSHFLVGAFHDIMIDSDGLQLSEPDYS